MAGLVKLNDPAGELSANYALQRQKKMCMLPLALQSFEFGTRSEQARSRAAARDKNREAKKWGKGAEEEEGEDEVEEEKALA